MWRMELYEILERNAFLNEDDSEHVWNLEAPKVESLYDALYSELRLHQYDGAEGPKSPFSFVASASMRAAIGCQYPPCVRRKLEFLAHYASLYCDLVFLPLPLYGSKKDSIPEQKAALEESIRTLGILRPAIEAGLVRPVPMTTRHCRHMLPFFRETRDIIDAAANDLQADAMTEFKATYQRPDCSPTGQPTVYLEGPEDLIEHGELVGTYPSPPFWVSKSWRYDSEGKHIVPRQKLRNIFRINQIFDKIASDTSFHLAFGSPFQARYLTDLPGEATLLEWLAGDAEIVAENEKIEKLLSHIIPVVGDLSLRSVVALRKKEPEAFQRYRDALTRIIDEFLRSHKRLTKKDAEELFHDYIESEVRKIRQAITSKRKSAAKQFAAGATGLFASVAIGAFALPVPLPIVTAVQAGSALLLGNTARECLAHSEERTNDFYFLLRLAQAAGRH
jgi:hypothetical protein